MKENTLSFSPKSLFSTRSTTFYLLFIFVSLVLLFTLLRGAFVLSVLFLLNILLSIIMRPFKQLYLGFEVNLISAVLASLFYGPLIGAIIGSTSAVVNFVVMGRISMFTPLAVFGYAAMGFIASFFASANIVSLGIWLSVIYNIFVSLPILLLFGGNISKCFVFAMSNIFFNVAVFSIFGGLFVHLT